MPKSILNIRSWLGLVLTLLPSVLVFIGAIDFPLHKTLMLVGTVLWFATRPLTLAKEPN